MTIADLFRLPTPAPVASCVRCGGTEHLIADEGEAICRGCVYAGGFAAGHPERLTVAVARALLAIHGDIVHLDRVVAIELDGPLWRFGSGWRWMWAGDPLSWPTGREV